MRGPLAALGLVLVVVAGGSASAAARSDRPSGKQIENENALETTGGRGFADASADFRAEAVALEDTMAETHRVIRTAIRTTLSQVRECNARTLELLDPVRFDRPLRPEVGATANDAAGRDVHPLLPRC